MDYGSGVVFGGTLERALNQLGFIKPSTLTSTQRQFYSSCRNISMAGAVLGIIFGCALGASSLLLLELEPSHKSIHFELDQILQDLLNTEKEKGKHEFTIQSDKCNVYFVGDTFSKQTKNRRPNYTNYTMNDAIGNDNVQSSFISGNVELQNDVICNDKGSEICHSVLCVPIMTPNTSEVIAVIEFIRMKCDTQFTETDVQLAQMLLHHTKIFLTKFVDEA